MKNKIFSGLHTKDRAPKGRVFSAVLWVIQSFVMATVVYSTTLVVGVSWTHRIILEVLHGTNFGTDATPSVVDVALFVGLPTIFILAVVFVFLILFYKKLWRLMSKAFGHLREKNKENLLLAEQEKKKNRGRV